MVKYVSELEVLLNRRCKGSIEPLLCMLLKDTEDRNLLIKYLRGNKYDNNHRSDPAPVEEGNSRPSLEEWISQFRILQ